MRPGYAGMGMQSPGNRTRGLRHEVAGAIFDVVPLNQALALGTVNFGDKGGAVNGIDHVNNVGPLPLATGNGMINGATLSHSGASASAGFRAGRNDASISITNANVDDLHASSVS